VITRTPRTAPCAADARWIASAPQARPPRPFHKLDNAIVSGSLDATLKAHVVESERPRVRKVGKNSPLTGESFTRPSLFVRRLLAKRRRREDQKEEISQTLGISALSRDELRRQTLEMRRLPLTVPAELVNTLGNEAVPDEARTHEARMLETWGSRNGYLSPEMAARSTRSRTELLHTHEEPKVTVESELDWRAQMDNVRRARHILWGRQRGKSLQDKREFNMLGTTVMEYTGRYIAIPSAAPCQDSEPWANAAQTQSLNGRQR